MAKALPQGKQVFLDDNGEPLAGGFVYMYVPSTTTDKDTWKNESETELNTNPIELDASGRAIIFGNGAYRQIVKDADGVTIWDKNVHVSEEHEFLWGGIATGTANNITVTVSPAELETESGDPVGGQIVHFMAGETNTGPVNVTVVHASGSEGPTELVKNTYIGPAPLEGGEIFDGNEVHMIYDDNAGQWFILNPIDVGLLYVPALFSVDSPVPDQIMSLIMLRSYTLPENATGSYAYAESVPEADYVFSLQKNGVEIGTVTFTSAANAGTIEVPDEVVFAANDRFLCVAPADADVNIAGIGIGMKLQRRKNG
jgi:hypothetical protein